MSEEITLDIKDLCYRILLKWKTIIAMCLIFAILGGLAGIAKDYKAVWDYNNEDKEGKLEEDREDLLLLRDALTERQLMEANEAIAAYDQLHEKYEDVQRYRTNSVLMQIEPNAVPVFTIRYQIDTHYKVEYPVIDKKDYSSDIINIYSAYIISDEVIDKIAADGVNISKEYLREIISVAGNTGDIFTVEIVGKDEAMCRSIAASIEKAVEDKTPELKKEYDNFDFKWLGDNYAVKARTDILSSQQSQLNTANSLRSGWMGLVSNMTEDQKKYYQAYLDYKQDKALLTATEEKIVDDELAAEAPEVDYFQLKFILIGFIFGAMLVCGWVVLFYVLKPVIRVNENITEAYKIPLLGNVWLKDDKRGNAEQKLTRLFFGNECDIEYEKRIEMIATGILIQMKKADLKSLYITGTAKGTEEVIKLLKKHLSKNLEVAAGDSVCYDPASLEALSQREAVVFVERIGVSRYDELSHQFEVVSRSKTEILGAIVVNQ